MYIYVYPSDTVSTLASSLTWPTAIAFTPSGSLTLTGTGEPGNADGVSSIATFHDPHGIVMDSSSVYLYVTCHYGDTIRKVSVSTGYTVTIAGGGTGESKDGIGLGASFDCPAYVVMVIIH